MRRSGAIVFSSCRGDEFSLESGAWRQGAFTYAVSEAIRERKADENRDGTIDTGELRKYVSERVPAMVEEVQTNAKVPEVNRMGQHPTVDRDNIYVRFGFPAGR